ncbi:MAG: DUF1016 N-terminal domain-containing protein [Deltaproteobacteria bacterium]|nr:DUF1016 N-terminal domain-containing protein [Deltaproteobacteria bacterium]
MQGLWPRNLPFMRSLAAAYPDTEMVKQLVSHLPWGHIIYLLQRVKDHDARSWYTRASIANGWSRSGRPRGLRGHRVYREFSSSPALWCFRTFFRDSINLPASFLEKVSMLSFL